MGAYNNLQEKFAGLKYGAGNATRVSTLICYETDGMDWGEPIFAPVGETEKGYKIHNNISTIVYSADFVALNSIIVNVNGVDSTPVVFDTDQATTMLALIAQLEADFTGLTVTRTDIAGDDRTLQLKYDAQDATSTSTVTLGASQPTAAVTASTDMVFMGINLFTQISNSSSKGKSEYQDSMNVMEEGWIYITTNVAVNANTNAYVIPTDGATQGLFSTSGFDVGARYRETISAAGVALLEVRGQKG